MSNRNLRNEVMQKFPSPIKTLNEIVSLMSFENFDFNEHDTGSSTLYGVSCSLEGINSEIFYGSSKTEAKNLAALHCLLSLYDMVEKMYSQMITVFKDLMPNLDDETIQLLREYTAEILTQQAAKILNKENTNPKEIPLIDSFPLKKTFEIEKCDDKPNYNLPEFSFKMLLQLRGVLRMAKKDPLSTLNQLVQLCKVQPEITFTPTNDGFQCRIYMELFGVSGIAQHGVKTTAKTLAAQKLLEKVIARVSERFELFRESNLDFGIEESTKTLSPVEPLSNTIVYSTTSSIQPKDQEVKIIGNSSSTKIVTNWIKSILNNEKSHLKITTALENKKNLDDVCILNQINMVENLDINYSFKVEQLIHMCRLELRNVNITTFGEGRSKQDAKKNCAKQALEKLKNEIEKNKSVKKIVPIDTRINQKENESTCEKLNIIETQAISWLNNRCQLNSWKLPDYRYDEKQDEKMFICKAKLESLNIESISDKFSSKRDAKKDAAYKVCLELEKLNL